MSDYESMGIQEYWIVDYLGLGGRRFIGTPKQPTFTVCTLVDGEYEIQQFRNSDRIFSANFPELPLTVDQIFNYPHTIYVIAFGVNRTITLFNTAPAFFHPIILLEKCDRASIS